MKKRFIALLAAAGIGIGGVACGTATEGAPPTTSAPAEEKPKAAKPAEQNDLQSFQLDDRSAYGMDDFWLVYKIKNDSSKPSDYTWDWEAVNSKGTRVDSGTILVFNVQPGQTATGEEMTLLDTGNVTIRVVPGSFDRTEAL